MMLKASQARWGGWGPHLTEPWLSPRMEIPPPLWSITHFSTILMVKTSSLAGFPKLHCPLPHVLVLCTSRESLHPLCALWLQSCSKAWSLIISINLVLLGYLSLDILDVFVRDDLEVCGPFSCFLAFWDERKSSLEKHQFVKDCWHFPFLFHITNLTSFPLHTLVTLACFISE